MVSLSVLVAAGEQDAAQRAIAEHAFEQGVLLGQGLLLPPVAARGDAALPDGCVVVCINDVRGTVEQGTVVDHLWRVVRSRGAALLDDEGTRTLLDLLHDSHPVLVEAARARFDLSFLCRRLQALLAEGIAITDLRGILEKLLIIRGFQVAAPSTDERALVLSEAGYDREVRTGLRNLIASRHARQGWLEVHVVDEGWRMALNSPLSAADRLKLQRAVTAAVGDASDAVLLTDAQTRPALRDLLHGDRPGLTVLAFTDLPPHLNIRQLAPVV